MRLLFKQRLFSWFDSYDIYDEAGNTVYTVEGTLAWDTFCVFTMHRATKSAVLGKKFSVGFLNLKCISAIDT